jgi:hypothetical protein
MLAAERPLSDGISPMNTLAQSPLCRFVTDGLHDTIASYAADTLPLHRFAWELETRLATLAELTGLPHWRALTALRVAQHTIAALDTTLRADNRTRLTSAEERSLAAALITLRTTLARLDPNDPDPADSPAARPVVLALLPRAAHHAAARPSLIA